MDVDHIYLVTSKILCENNIYLFYHSTDNVLDIIKDNTDLPMQIRYNPLIVAQFSPREICEKKFDDILARYKYYYPSEYPYKWVCGPLPNLMDIKVDVENKYHYPPIIWVIIAAILVYILFSKN